MKLLKKLSGMLLSLLLAAAMTVPALAAEPSGSITIKDTVEGKSYDLYKIFDLTQSGEKVAYTVDPDWEAFFGSDGAGSGYIVEQNNAAGSLNQIAVNGVTKYINITEENVSEFAEAALAYAAEKKADQTVAGKGEDVTAENLALGYYLIYPRGAADIKEGYGSICSLDSTTPDAMVEIKADYPTIDKEVDDTNPEIGQTVTYTITGQVPDTTGYETYTYEVTDKMSEGLTFNKDVVVKIDDKEVAVVPDYATTTNGFKVVIDVMSQQENVGKDIVITYTATVNEKAVVGSEGNPNEATLNYSNDPSDSEKKTTNPPVIIKVYTAKLIIDKVDGGAEDKDADAAKLAGAKFVLKNSEEKYYKYDVTDNVVSWVADIEDATEVTTDASGAASFNGLKNGTYLLVETEAPDGFNKLTEEVSVKINYNDGVANVGQTTRVENNSGTELPSTGGMGTTMFYVIGGILVVAAGVLLVTRRRMSREK